MSFYQILSSDENRDANSHGGDFKLILDQALDFRYENWEVALVNIAYTGQAFNNISDADSVIGIKLVKTTTFFSEYIVTYAQSLDLSISIYDNFETPARIVKFPRMHYTLSNFRETFTNLVTSNMCSVAKCEMTDDRFKIYAETTEEEMNNCNIKFSDGFCQLFSFFNTDIRTDFDWDTNLRSYKVYMTIPTVKEDNSLVIFTPYTGYEDVSMKSGNVILFEFTRQFWTIKMFKAAILALSDKAFFDTCEIQMFIDTTNISKSEMIITTFRKRDDSPLSGVQINFSDTFKLVLGIKEDYVFIPYSSKAIITLNLIGMTPPQDIKEPITRYVNLTYNYFPSIRDLLENMNYILGTTYHKMLEGLSMIPALTQFFVRDKNNVVSYTHREHFQIQISFNLLKMFNMSKLESWLTESQTGSATAVLKSHSRSFFYVHCDCIDYHFVNNKTSNLIRVVENKSTVNEQSLVTFNDPHYYKVSKHQTICINMYITDDLYDNILRFHNDVSYTLHFRKCHFI